MKHRITVALALGALSFACCATSPGAGAGEVEVVSTTTLITLSGMT